MFASRSVSARQGLAAQRFLSTSRAVPNYATYRVHQLGNHKLPEITNEPNPTYAPNSPEREKLMQAVEELRSQSPQHVPLIINGKEVKTGNVERQFMPSEHSKVLCTYENAGPEHVEEAIEGALAAKSSWENLPIYDRQAIFLRAADLLSQKYRYKAMAATMLGQGKNIWQAEIDAAAETCDFLRYNVKFSEEVYSSQPAANSRGIWNRVEHRPLEGFVYAVSPFNFTAIGANLATAPALMGNTVVWKPAPAATLSNYVIYQILQEAGLPDGVIQFIPGPAAEITRKIFDHPEFSSLHFTGSTKVFKDLWKEISNNLDKYRGYPRIVGETGGKNFHLLHKSADVTNAVNQSVRAAFEFQGQKCSALSRLYVPDNLWPQFKKEFVEKVNSIKVGNITDPSNFMGPVINKLAFDKITGYIEHARNAPECEIIAGGKYDESTGYFIQPTVVETKDPFTKTMKEEIFGPVVTAYVYPAEDFDGAIELANSTASYGLTGAIFSQDRNAAVYATSKLTHAAGNFYVNDKCTGAVVGQQSFGGARASGTNDKGGSANLLHRFVSPRSIKENFIPLEDFNYPSNQ
ncbi:1-pyrroline-5-carboxylate dehydrogenase [Mycoemilia scoparia]|uniref:Multifunctional fusion protein n=1 Tax=Mycoemilia scoparia TaxID=417184 RepID=A0A9W8A203_9FUNG|nr:1-pyrroline-5-carboxylate dehydrogenase [Mycoemilia scoparia]